MSTSEFEILKEHSMDNLGTGTKQEKLVCLEKDWEIKMPSEYRRFILEIGYAEIFNDEIYSIYEVPDKVPCLGLHWMNRDNQELANGFIRFFSNDIDGAFFIHCVTGKVYLNELNSLYAQSFKEFVVKLINS